MPSIPKIVLPTDSSLDIFGEVLEYTNMLADAKNWPEHDRQLQLGILKMLTKIAAELEKLNDKGSYEN